MDPTEVLKTIEEIIYTGMHNKNQDRGEEVDQLCDDLLNWINKGGLEPNWEEYPLGTSYYDSRRAMRKMGLT